MLPSEGVDNEDVSGLSISSGSPINTIHPVGSADTNQSQSNSKDGSSAGNMELRSRGGSHDSTAGCERQSTSTPECAVDSLATSIPKASNSFTPESTRERVTSDERSESVTASIPMLGGTSTTSMERSPDSGVDGFMTSQSSASALSVEKSPPKCSPEYLRRESSTDEGIMFDTLEKAEEILAACRQDTPRDIPNRGLCSMTPPISIPNSYAARNNYSIPPSPHFRAQSTSSVSSSAEGMQAMSLGEDKTISPPLPEKPKSFAPSPGQPLDTKGYATLTADDLKVDRSTKPTRRSDPNAPAIDRAAKPKAPINATLPNSNDFELLSQAQAFVQANGRTIPVYDHRGQPLLVPQGGAQLLTLPAGGVSHAAASSNYQHPPPPRPARVGSADSPYCVPPPPRAATLAAASHAQHSATLPAHATPSSHYSHPPYSRLSSSSSAGQFITPVRTSNEGSPAHSAPVPGYEQVPSNRPFYNRSVSYQGQSTRSSSRSSVGSRTSTGSLANGGGFVMIPRVSQLDFNDGGDYVMTPAQHPRQSSEPIQVSSEDYQDYEPMSPNGFIPGK